MNNPPRALHRIKHVLRTSGGAIGILACLCAATDPLYSHPIGFATVAGSPGVVNPSVLSPGNGAFFHIDNAAPAGKAFYRLRAK